MAPKGSRGKAIDRTTEWSDFEWDQRGFWVSSRLDKHGEKEYRYDYRYPEGTTTQDTQNTPRSPGPNILNDSNAYYPTTTSSTDTSYATYESEYNPSYVTSNDPARYGSTRGYEVSSQSSQRGTFQSTNEYASSDTESVATVVPYASNPSCLANTTYPIAPQAYQNTATAEDLTQSFGEMAIAGPSASPQYNTTAIQQDERRIPNIRPSGANYGKLDPRYKVIEEKRQKKFWRVGRVFMVLWIEPAGKTPQNAEGASSTTGSQFSRTYLEGTAFSEIRRFVVVGEGHGNSICSPIHTYNGQATLKYNLPEPSQHTIIYTSEHPPPEHWYQANNGQIVREDLSKDPIKVTSEQEGPEGELDPLSRINYSKVYTVEYYVRVLNIGMVADESIPSLIRNSIVKPRELPIERPRHHPKRTSSQQDERKGRGKGRDKEKDKEKEKKRRS